MLRRLDISPGRDSMTVHTYIETEGSTGSAPQNGLMAFDQKRSLTVIHQEVAR